MQESRRIEDQLQRSFRGPAWHGPSLEDLLHDVDYELAAGRPLPNTHSIWEIVLHLTAWYDAVRRRLHGENLELAGEQDWPPVPEPGDAAWKIALGNLETAHEKMRGEAMALDSSRLDDRAPGKRYSIYVMLHGLIQHNLYHAGQIAILKKT